MRVLLDRLYIAGGGLGAICVLLIALMMIAQSIARETGISMNYTNDVVAWLCASASFLMMAHAFKHGDFVRVTLLLERLPTSLQRKLEMTSLLVAALAVGYLTWWATRFTYESWEFHEMSNGILAIPLWIPQTGFVVGSWLFFVAVIDELLLVLTGSRPSYVVAVERRHAQGDFSSDV